MPSFKALLARTLLLAVVAQQTPAIVAQTGEAESSDARDPTHRLDIGIDWFDTPSGTRASSAAALRLGSPQQSQFLRSRAHQ